MRQFWLAIMAVLLVVAVWQVNGKEAALPFAGNWKVLDVSSGNETTWALLQIAYKDGKPQAKVLAAPLLGDSVSVENLKVDDRSLQFELKVGEDSYQVKAYSPRAGDKSKGVRGTITLNKNLRLAQFNKTDDTQLTAEDAESQTADGESLAKALALDDAKEKFKALQEVAEQARENAAVYLAAAMVLEDHVKDRAKEELIRDLAEKYARIGALYGPEVEARSTAHACRLLMRYEKVSPAALALARRAETSMTKDAHPESSLLVLKSLAAVLRRTGKDGEAKEVQTRIDKLEEPLDAEFAKTAIPFAPAAYKGPRGGTRVALVELFTGAYCPLCVAADVAFDAALESYKSRDVVFMQYHLHIPRSDRLTNAEAEERAKYYERDIRGVPTAFVNGTATEALGGSKGDGKKSSDTLRGTIDRALDATGGGLLSLDAKRAGDQIDITCEVTQLKKPGRQMKLRFVLIEETVRYPGGNGQRIHHLVVRGFPGGVAGVPLTETRARRKVAVNLAELRKNLDDYLKTAHQGDHPFADDEYPLNLKGLKVIAFIQDDDSKDILQAVQVDVPKEK